MNRKQLAARLREHAELHEELSEHRDEEQKQWARDLRAAADIVDDLVHAEPRDDDGMHQ